MDPNNYVAPAPGGGFVTVVGGKVVGNFPTQSAAEGAYNGASGPTGSSGGSGGSGGLTTAQMTQDLQAAGYNGPWDDASVQAAYARTVNGGNAGAGWSTDVPTDTLLESQARDAAINAYELAQAQNLPDRLAFDKAVEAWTQTVQSAQMTGLFNGQPTQAAQLQKFNEDLAAAGITGVYNSQPTLAAQAQNNSEALDLMKFQAGLSGPANAFKYAQALAGTPNGLSDIVRAASGQYQLPGTGGGNGQPIEPLSIQSIINDINKYTPASAPATTPTGTPPPATPTTPPGGVPVGSYQTINGVKTLAQMQNELRTAGWNGNYADANAVAAAYASTSKGAVTAGTGAAPQVATANPPTAAPQAAAPQTATAPVPFDQRSPGITGSGPLATPASASGSTAPGALAQYQPAAPGSQATPSYASQQAATQVAPSYAGQRTPNTGEVSDASASFASQTQNGGNGYVPQYGPLPAPNGIAPQAWNQMDPSQQQLLLAAYGQAGYNQQDVLAEFNKSLKGYGGPSSGSVGF